MNASSWPNGLRRHRVVTGLFIIFQAKQTLQTSGGSGTPKRNTHVTDSSAMHLICRWSREQPKTHPGHTHTHHHPTRAGAVGRTVRSSCPLCLNMSVRAAEKPVAAALQRNTITTTSQRARRRRAAAKHVAAAQHTQRYIPPSRRSDTRRRRAAVRRTCSPCPLCSSYGETHAAPRPAHVTSIRDQCTRPAYVTSVRAHVTGVRDQRT